MISQLNIEDDDSDRADEEETEGQGDDQQNDTDSQGDGAEGASMESQAAMPSEMREADEQEDGAGAAQQAEVEMTPGTGDDQPAGPGKALVYGHGVFTIGRAGFREPFQAMVEVENWCRAEYFRRLAAAHPA